MKLFRLWSTGVCAALLSFASLSQAAALALSGTVYDKDNKPLSGVVVSLALGKVSATTDASGAWSLATAPAGIASRVAVPVAHGRLMLEDGRLSVRFDDRDVSGRGQGRAVATPRPMAVAARTADIPDTLLYTWMGKVRLRDTISSSQTGIVRTLDTTPITTGDIPWQTGITYGSVTHGGQTYKTVKIGTQTWMAENLNYAGASGTVGKCYGNSADSCSKYGRLYTWAEVMQGATTSSTSPNGVQGICPTSWHVPSDAEWQALVNAVDASGSTGTQLKSTAGWNGSGNGTDDYGFRALPGGDLDGTSINYVGRHGNWWSATEFDASDAWGRYMSYIGDGVYRNFSDKPLGYSLRCSKD